MMAVFLPKGLDCQTCTDQQKMIRGCTEDSPNGWLIGDTEVKRCPISLLTADTIAYLKLYRMAERFGRFPYEGGIATQPAKLMDIFSYIDICYARKQSEELEKVKNKRGK